MWEEPRFLVDTEKDQAWTALLELAGQVGRAQMNLLPLCMENVDWHMKTVTDFLASSARFASATKRCDCPQLA